MIANAGVVKGIMPMASMAAPISSMASRLSNFNDIGIIVATLKGWYGARLGMRCHHFVCIITLTLPHSPYTLWCAGIYLGIVGSL